MARPLRIEYPGALYHVTTRGNERKDIFKSRKDREQFLSYLESAMHRYGAVIHAYCLMGNHYHLLLETPHGNLSQIMKHINSSYTMYHNVKWKRVGHLVQGRYKAILVEADTYLCELSRYMHLNPVRAGVVAAPEGYPWMSYHCYTGDEAAPTWLTTSFILGCFGADEAEAQKRYRLFVHDLVSQGCSSPLEGTVAATILGSPDFIAEVQALHLSDRSEERDVPALRKLSGKPSLNEISQAVRDAFSGNERLAKNAGIFLCHRYSGKRLREIGELFGLTESGITRASKRFEQEIERDKSLRDVVRDVLKILGLSIA